MSHPLIQRRLLRENKQYYQQNCDIVDTKNSDMEYYFY